MSDAVVCLLFVVCELVLVMLVMWCGWWDREDVMVDVGALFPAHVRILRLEDTISFIPLLVLLV
jgi:hypothetical protein